MTNLGNDWYQLFDDIRQSLENVLEQQLAKSKLGPIGPILTKLLHIQKQEITLLKSIKQDVNSLVEAPYREGMRWVQMASEAHRTEYDRRKFIENARDSFVQALSQERDYFRQALINRQLAVCWLLLGPKYRMDAKEAFEQSHTFAVDYLSALQKETNKFNIIDCLIYIMAVVVTILVAVVAFSAVPFIAAIIISFVTLGSLFSIPGGLKKQIFKKKGKDAYEVIQTLHYNQKINPSLMLQLSNVPSAINTLF